jgi:hypothetical protein
MYFYSRAKLEAIVGDKDPAFWPESVSPFYSLPTGRRSCYNDLGYCMLRSLSHTVALGASTVSTGGYDRSAYIASMCDLFGENTEYAQALARRKEAYDPAK